MPCVCVCIVHACIHVRMCEIAFHVSLPNPHERPQSSSQLCLLRTSMATATPKTMPYQGLEDRSACSMITHLICMHDSSAQDGPLRDRVEKYFQRWPGEARQHALACIKQVTRGTALCMEVFFSMLHCYSSQLTTHKALQPLPEKIASPPPKILRVAGSTYCRLHMLSHALVAYSHVNLNCNCPAI